MVLQGNRSWIVAFWERDRLSGFASGALSDKLIEFGQELLAGWRASALDVDTVQALAAARLCGGWYTSGDAEVGNKTRVDSAGNEGVRDCSDSCDKREQWVRILHDDGRERGTLCWRLRKVYSVENYGDGTAVKRMTIV